MKRLRKTVPLSFLLLMWILSGCGNSLNCAIKGDNIKGHVNFMSAIPAQAGKNIVIQYSTDSFSSVKDSKTISNWQGLLAVPYTFCADNDVNAVFRAFQDDNGNAAWDSGEGAGRNDGTSDGNAAFISHNLPAPQPSANPPVEWKVDTGVDMWIDSTTAQ